MSNTPFEMLKLIKNGGNPQQLVLSMLQERTQGNPVLENLLSLAKNNDQNGIENFARNLLKENGMDFDKEFKSFRETFGI